MRTDRLFEIMDYKSLLNRSGLQIPTSRSKNGANPEEPGSNRGMDQIAQYNNQQAERAKQTTKNVNTATAAIGGTAVLAPLALYGATTITGGAIISSEAWAFKAGISATFQMIMNKGDLSAFDACDMAADALLLPGANAIIGGSIDYFPFAKGNQLNIVGINKPLDKALLDASTSYLSGGLGSKSMNGLAPFLNNKTEGIIMNSVVSTPFLLLDKGSNKVAKVYLYNEKK